MSGLRINNSTGITPNAFNSMYNYGDTVSTSVPEDYVNLGNGISGPSEYSGISKWLSGSPGSFGSGAATSSLGGASTFEPSFMQGLTGYRDPSSNQQVQGWGSLALGGVQTGFNIWQGMNQLKMAKDQLSFTKDAFNKNYAAQRQSTNTALADRQAARVASNAGAYQSVGEYMNQNRIA